MYHYASLCTGCFILTKREGSGVSFNNEYQSIFRSCLFVLLTFKPHWDSGIETVPRNFVPVVHDENCISLTSLYMYTLEIPGQNYSPSFCAGQARRWLLLILSITGLAAPDLIIYRLQSGSWNITALKQQICICCIDQLILFSSDKATVDCIQATTQLPGMIPLFFNQNNPNSVFHPSIVPVPPSSCSSLPQQQQQQQPFPFHACFRRKRTGSCLHTINLLDLIPHFKIAPSFFFYLSPMTIFIYTLQIDSNSIEWKETLF